MKKLIAMLLALTMVLSLAACGESQTPTNEAQQNSSTQDVQKSESDSKDESTETIPIKESETDVTEAIEYAVGQAFGTDNVECVITEIKWLSPEEYQSVAKIKSSGGKHYLSLDTDLLFPEYDVWGQTGILEDKASETSFIWVYYTLQNVGKEAVSASQKATGDGSYWIVPYGTIAVICDDGYIFDVNEYSGFTSGLDVLSDPVKGVGIISFPNQVLESEDKPVKLKVTLPNSAGETEEFYVIAR